MNSQIVNVLQGADGTGDEVKLFFGVGGAEYMTITCISSLSSVCSFYQQSVSFHAVVLLV